jgi:hypothetical protein
MPSPLGHALGGLTVGLLALPRHPRAAAPWLTPLVVACAAAAMAPDLDFLWHRHSMETHSVGAALIAGAVAGAATRQWRWTLAITLAWATHPLFDWLGSDDGPPLGVVALWPWSHEYYFGYLYVFDSIGRNLGDPNFWPSNLRAVLKEVVCLGPGAACLLWWHTRPPGPRCR